MHLSVQVDVAIKTLNEQYTESGKTQFLQEAEVMVRLDHPCIVSLVGVSEGPPIMLVCCCFVAALKLYIFKLVYLDTCGNSPRRGPVNTITPLL